jgi:acetyl-CoA C-acetyltransferase
VIDPRTPCVIGVAQHTVPKADGPAPEPLVLWERVCRAAAEDAAPGRGGRVLAAADELDVVYCQSWPYDRPVDRLADALGIAPRRRVYSGIGGTIGQVLVQTAGRAILAGQLDLAVITGAETLETIRQATRVGTRPSWSFPHPQPQSMPFEAPFHPAEVAHGVRNAWVEFPVFDVARRARLGVEPEAYRSALGELLSPFTRVAAANPRSWFPVARTPEEITAVTPVNRLIGYPYTKYMVSVIDVDMAAAVIVASEAAADRLGVGRDRRVYLRGWCYADDPVYLAEHRDLSASPAMAAASAEALRGAGAGIDDVAHIDLYSCYPSSINLARDALRITAGDGRDLTVTGGLPYFGGPSSNYATHSIATMTEVLRADPGSLGLLNGIGMYLTKHVFGVYSTTPPPGGAATVPDEDAVQARLDDRVAICDRHAGPATVAGYSIAHGRSGAAEWGIAVCDLPDGRRAYARIVEPALLDAFERAEWVGAGVTLVGGPGAVNEVRA